MNLRSWTPWLLIVSAAAVAAESIVWAWTTFSYWETGPLLPTVLGTGVLALVGSYVEWKRWWFAITLGLASTLGLFVAVAAVTGLRWSR